MKKELVIAIIIGFSLGLVVTFGIWTANKSLKKAASTTQEISETKTGALSPTPTTSSSLLIINSPEQDFLTDVEKINVSGKTVPESTVAIVYENGEKILSTDSEGNFSTEITLISGANEIKISSFDKDDNEVTKTITGVYSKAEI